MRYWEIIAEARTPNEEVILYTDEADGNRNLLVIGGRVLGDKSYTLDHAMAKINLKNVRSPHGPLLFHGTADPSITNFSGECWFSTEPHTATFHASFKKGLMHGPQATIYVCAAKVSKPVINPDITPGDEQPGEIEAVYAANPNSDAIIWKGASDAGIGPVADLYNIKDGSQVSILKVWRLRDEIISTDDYERVLAGDSLEDERKRPVRKAGATYKVIEPGLTPFEVDSYIDDEEYEEFKDYMKVEKLS